MDFTPVYINKENILNVLKILKTYLGESYYGADDKYVEWQYFLCPFKTTMTDKNEYSILAFIDNNILALDAFLPWQTLINGEEVNTVWDVEWFNFSQIKGLGRELVKILRERTQVYCGYGVNRLSRNAYEKLGYSIKNEIERKIAILDADKCFALFGNNAIKGQKEFLRECAVNHRHVKISYNEIKNLKNISEDYWENHIRRFSVTSCKDKRALNWRYCEHPYIDYSIIALDKDAKKGLSVVRLEKIRGMHEKVLRILELLPADGYEKDFVNAVLEFGFENGAILADFFCVSKKCIDQVCPGPFIGLSEHRGYDIPMLFQPMEIRERKSINMVLDWDKKFSEALFDTFYATKGDGDQDQFVNEDYRTANL